MITNTATDVSNALNDLERALNNFDDYKVGDEYSQEDYESEIKDARHYFNAVRTQYNDLISDLKEMID